MSFTKIFTCCILASVFFIVCNDEKPANETSTVLTEKKEPEKVKPGGEQPNESPEYLAGKKLFMQNCLTCHQQDGMGVQGMNPPLSRTSWVLGGKDKLIGIVLNGLNGGVEIDGETYSNAMGSFAMLKDKEIALILTYVRSSFGNDADAVKESEVARVRASNK